MLASGVIVAFTRVVLSIGHDDHREVVGSRELPQVEHHVEALVLGIGEGQGEVDLGGREYRVARWRGGGDGRGQPEVERGAWLDETGFAGS